MNYRSLMGLYIAFLYNNLSAQTNSFPLYSAGNGQPQLRLDNANGMVNVVHYSSDPNNSTTYDYQTGKNVYWGETTDGGNYIFRGRNLFVQEGIMGIGSLRGVFDVGKDGDIYLAKTPLGGSTQSVYIGGNTHLASYGSGNISYLQAGEQSHPGSTELQVRTFDNGNLIEAMHINGAGNVSIGTTDAKGYRLAVNGNAIFTKIKVQAYPWPDYVFQKNYLLRPLDEVEQFIHQYQRLPDMPSATEVEKNGLDLGDNQAALLKKIEELTLYVIDLNKKNEELQKQVEKLNDIVLKK